MQRAAAERGRGRGTGRQERQSSTHAGLCVMGGTVALCPPTPTRKHYPSPHSVPAVSAGEQAGLPDCSLNRGAWEGQGSLQESQLLRGFIGRPQNRNPPPQHWGGGFGSEPAFRPGFAEIKTSPNLTHF